MIVNISNSFAAEWSVTPRVHFGGQYDDNRTLSTSTTKEIAGSTITPGVSFNRVNPNSAASIGARAQFTQYSDNEIRDTNVQYLIFNTHYRPQPQSIWRMNGSLRRDTTITTIQNVDELVDETIVDEDTGEPIDTDVGLVEVEVRRNRLNVSPSWQYTWTERTSLNLSYGFSTVYYSDSQGADLVDHRTHALDTSLSRKMTKNDNLGMSLHFSQFNAPDNNTDSDNISVNVRYGHDFEQDLKGNFSVGYRDTTTTTETTENTSGGLVLNLGINKKQTRLTSYNVSIRHGISASGSGRVLQSDQLNVRLRSRLTARLSTSLDAQAFDTKTLEGDITNADRVYYSIKPGLHWLMTRNWKINGSYRYRRQKRELASEAAESNSINVSINYTWPKMSASR